MVDSPPPIADTSTGKKNTYHDPYSFGLSGSGVPIGLTPLDGAGAFFGQYEPYTPVQRLVGAGTMFGRVAPKAATLTVDEAMTAFLHSSPSQMAAIQSQMYRAGGYYSAKFVPDYGHIRAEDISAFRQFLIGYTASPNPNGLGTELTQQALYGDAKGVNTNKRSPLVIKLTNPDDIRAAVHKAAMDLYGGDLNEEQLQSFVNTFQQQQAQYQTQAYQAGGYNPETGQQDINGLSGAGTTVTQPADLGVQAEALIRKTHPEQVLASEFGRTLSAILPGLLGPGAGLIGG